MENKTEKKRLIINLEPELYEKLKSKAKEEFSSLTQVIKDYIKSL